MLCSQAQRFVAAYLDGELDLTQCLEMETHLADCPVCQQVCVTEQALKAALKQDGLYFTAPPALKTRLLRSLPQEDRAPALLRWNGRWRSYSLAAAAALLLLFALFAYRSAPPSSEDIVAQEVLSGHIRSLLAAHLFDVRSSDRHTVKPWFNGKIDYAPVVEDMTAQGFPLIGGRLDYVNNRPVAALVYQSRKHIINLYLWPVGREADLSLRPVSLRGYFLWHWTKAGMTYWAVSDLNSSALQQFVLQFQRLSRTGT